MGWEKMYYEIFKTCVCVCVLPCDHQSDGMAGRYNDRVGRFLAHQTRALILEATKLNAVCTKKRKMTISFSIIYTSFLFAFFFFLAWGGDRCLSSFQRSLSGSWSTVDVFVSRTLQTMTSSRCSVYVLWCTGVLCDVGVMGKLL